MSFSSMMQILKSAENNKVLLIKLGIFYTAIGEDAVYLSESLGLKCVCFKKEVCKIGIPINSIEMYLNKLKKLECAYVVYDIDKNSGLLIKKYCNNGRYHNISIKNKNCKLCKKTDENENDFYLKALRKSMEEGTL